jgi:hypothetical protein
MGLQQIMSYSMVIYHIGKFFFNHGYMNFVFDSPGGSKSSKASDVAVSCLEKLVTEYQSHHMEHAKDIATLVFRLLIVHPKVT